MARFLESVGVRFEREQTISFCSQGNKTRARIDFVIYREWGIVLLEVDEGQHVQYPVTCETARMMDIIAEHVRAGRDDKLKIVRFNPDAFKLDFKPGKVPQKDRQASLLKAIRDEPEQHFEIKRTHTGEKPCVCDFPNCGSAFSQSNVLTKHKQRLHSERGVQRQKKKE